MIYVLLAILILAVLATALLCSQLKIIVEYRNETLSLTFRCLFFKFVISGTNFQKKNAPQRSDNGKDKAGSLGRIQGFRQRYNDVKDILAEILDLVKNRAEFSGIFIRLKYGTGDAAITGVIYGAIWSLVGNIYSLLCRFFRVEFPTLELEPVFGSKAFEIEAEGIITTRLVHIITAVIRSLKIYFKQKKGAK